MKGNHKSLNGKVLLELLKLQGVAPFIVLLCAVAMLAQAAYSVNLFMKEAQEVERNSRLPKFTLKSNPVGRKAYESYAEVLNRISPKVMVKGESKGLVVSINDANHYPEFMYVLNSVQGLSKRVIWQADSICLAKCEGAQGMAVIQGVEESIEVSLKGDEK